MKEAATACAPAVPVERLEVRAYQVPTDGPGGVESDGTLTWHDTTCVVVHVSRGRPGRASATRTATSRSPT